MVKGRNEGDICGVSGYVENICSSEQEETI